VFRLAVSAPVTSAHLFGMPFERVCQLSSEEGGRIENV
jgi:hypothetical protein